MTVEDRFASALSDYLDDNRPAGFPAAAALPFRVESDESSRPLPVAVVVIDDTEELIPLRGTYRVDGAVEVISQPKETAASDHRTWAGCIAGVIYEKAPVLQTLNHSPGDSRAEPNLHVHDLRLSGGTTTTEGDLFITRVRFSAAVTGRPVMVDIGAG